MIAYDIDCAFTPFTDFGPRARELMLAFGMTLDSLAGAPCTIASPSHSPPARFASSPARPVRQIRPPQRPLRRTPPDARIRVDSISSNPTPLSLTPSTPPSPNPFRCSPGPVWPTSRACSGPPHTSPTARNGAHASPAHSSPESNTSSPNEFCSPLDHIAACAVAGTSAARGPHQTHLHPRRMPNRYPPRPRPRYPHRYHPDPFDITTGPVLDQVSNV
jgi:hypothetical protein